GRHRHRTERHRSVRHVYIDGGRVSGRVRSRAARDGERQLARVPAARGRAQACGGFARARRTGLDGLSSPGAGSCEPGRRNRHPEPRTENLEPMDPVLTKFVREHRAYTLDFYLKHEGYEGL